MLPASTVHLPLLTSILFTLDSEYAIEGSVDLHRDPTRLRLEDLHIACPNLPAISMRFDLARWCEQEAVANSPDYLQRRYAALRVAIAESNLVMPRVKPDIRLDFEPDMKRFAL
jgi:hypothetical protein